MAEWLASGLGFVINHIEQAFDKFIGLDQVPTGREWTEFDTYVLRRSLFEERIDGLTKRRARRHLFAERSARARGLFRGRGRRGAAGPTASGSLEFCARAAGATGSARCIHGIANGAASARKAG